MFCQCDKHVAVAHRAALKSV